MDRPLLILDLDETLIYASETPLLFEPAFCCGPFHVYKRPFLSEFISIVSRFYDLAVWTSSSEEYARCVVHAILGEVSLQFLWSRDRCTQRFDYENREHYWVKNLKKVKRAGFNLKRVLVVDDSSQKLESSYGNLVHVNEFNGDPGDRALEPLAAYLVSIAGVEDLQRIDKRSWRGTGR